MDALLDEALHVAVHFLEKNGEFFPFGVTMTEDGKINHAQAWTGEEHPGSDAVIDHLVAGFAQGAKRGDYRATALASDVRLSLDGANQTDAIRVTIEHCQDEPVTCYLPYVNREGSFDFGELVAVRADRFVFLH